MKGKSGCTAYIDKFVFKHAVLKEIIQTMIQVEFYSLFLPSDNILCNRNASTHLSIQTLMFGVREQKQRPILLSAYNIRLLPADVYIIKKILSIAHH